VRPHGVLGPDKRQHGTPQSRAIDLIRTQGTKVGRHRRTHQTTTATIGSQHSTASTSACREQHSPNSGSDSTDLPPGCCDRIRCSESLKVGVAGPDKLPVAEPERGLYEVPGSKTVAVGIESALPDGLGDQGGTGIWEGHGLGSITFSCAGQAPARARRR
jgi:hypothetical protein